MVMFHSFLYVYQGIYWEIFSKASPSSWSKSDPHLLWLRSWLKNPIDFPAMLDSGEKCHGFSVDAPMFRCSEWHWMAVKVARSSPGGFLAAAPGGPNDKSAVLSHDHHPVPVQREFIDV